MAQTTIESDYLSTFVKITPMKKSYLVLLLMLSASLLQAGIIKKSWNIPHPEIIGHGDYEKIFFPNTLQTNRAGEPSLPYFAVNLLLPPGEEAVSVDFKGEDEIAIDGTFQLYPYQPSRTLNDTSKASFVKNELVYASGHSYPATSAGRLKTAYMNGYGFAMSAFTPVKYVPATGKLSYFKKVTIIIHTKKTSSAELHLKNLKTAVWVRDKVLKLAQNPKAIELYKAAKSRSMVDYRLLIVTGTNYLNSFDSLRNIYLERGIRSKVYSVDYINNNISGQDSQEKIRNFIIQEYQNYGVEFVLLGGDVEIVPYRGFYCYVISGGGVESNDIPADLYYSALDGTWNDDGDSHWGEPDEDDLLPDVSVARMPFSNTTELNALIHKSIWYQNKPVLGEFTKPLLAGEFLYSDPETWGSQYLNLLIGTHSDNGYTTTGIPPSYDIDSLYEKHQSWTGTTLINHINQGKEFVHHVGHANQTYVAHLTNSDITNANFYAVDGVTHNYTLFHTHGCDCGAFDYDDCILERMVNIDNFAAAVIGNSRYGWFNEGQTEGPAAHLHRETEDALFHDSLSMLGRALMEAKIATSPWVEAPGQWEEGALRWNFYDLNALGDPAMSIWTDEPVSVNVTCNTSITIGTDSVAVYVEANGSPAHNYTCSILKENTLLGYGITDSTGNAWVVFDTLNTVPGTGRLVVSGYNCLPDTTVVTFVPSGTAFVIYAGNTISDPTGNNNGAADFGETILLNVSLANVGTSDAHNVNSLLSSLNGNVTITDDTAYFGTILAADTVLVNGAFVCNVAGNVPDQESVIFQLVDTADEGSWQSDFSITINAPQLATGSLLIDDSESGNNNGALDPGETALIIIPSSNLGHADCDSAVETISLNSEWITVNNAQVMLDTLLAGETKNAVFQVEVDPNTPLGTSAPFSCHLSSGAYFSDKDYTVSVGLQIEDFETGDFTKFEWQQGGSAPWTVTSDAPFEGVYCAKSGAVGDLQHSDLFVTLTTVGNDTIHFARKVSSEDTYDFLRFYIDDVLQGEWSGEKEWSTVSFPVDEGNHTLLWSYEKDFSASAGSDCGWIDNIVFPATTVAVKVKNHRVGTALTVYPNPGNGLFAVNFGNPVTDALNLTVYNAQGKKVLCKRVSEGSASTTIDLSAKGKGLYLLYIGKTKDTKVIKLIVE